MKGIIMRRYLAFFTVSILVASGLIFIPHISFNNVSGTTIYVGPGGNYTKIQDAIDAASNGDTIRIFSGNYTENIQITKSIDLVGNGSKNTTIYGNNAGTIVYLNSNDVTISNVSVIMGDVGYNYGVEIASGKDNITVKDCNLTDMSRGIFLSNSGSSNIKILNNSFYNNSFGIHASNSDHVLIQGNTMNGTNYGIYCKYTNNHTVKENVFTNTNYIAYYETTTYSNYTYNNIINTRNHGIYIKDSNFCIIENNSILKVNNQSYLYSSDLAGIYLYRSDDNRISNNTINDGDKPGIILRWSDGNHLKNNSLFNCGITFATWLAHYWDGNVIDESNSVNNKKFLYLNRISNRSFSDIGQAYIGYCSNITIQDSVLENCSRGIVGNKNDNITIQNCSSKGIEYGLWMSDSKDTHFINCSVNSIIERGVTIYDDDRASVIGCKFHEKEFPIYQDSQSLYLRRSRNIQFKNTSFINSGILFSTSKYEYMEYFSTHQFTNTTVNGKPFKYYSGKSNLTISGPAGQILIVDCDNLTVNNTIINSSTTHGIFSRFSKNISVTNSTVVNCYDGIILEDHEGSSYRFSNNNCSNNYRTGISVIDSKRVGYELIVTNNVCNNNSGSGIEFNGFLNNCIIFNNTCHNNDYNGIGGGSFTDYIVYHSNITVSMNNISGSQQGISISIVKNLTVESNWIKNSHYGIRLEQVINANISHNEVSNIGYVGIHLLGCRNGLLEYNVVCNSTHSGISYIRGGIQFEYRRISNNNLSFNNKYGLYLAADLVNVENNTFYKNRLYGAYVIIEPGIGNGGSHIFANRFIDNNNGSHQAYSDKPNYWDNGFIGNYWSDHQGPDSNGDGIVDIPYNISGDGGLKDNYPLVFGNSNPKINSTNVLNVIYNTVYNVVYHAYDVNYDPIFWSMKTNADWLNFYSNNRTLVGYPKSQHKGFYWVNISISDGRGGKDWTNFTLEVLKPNDAPIITTTDQLSVNEDALYNVTYNASDVDPHDIHSWNFSSNATFLSFNHTIRNLTGIPDNGDVGIYWVNISVNDNNGSVVWTNFTLTVLNVNDDPVITTINQLGAVEDILYIRDYDADDIDPTDDNLRWSLNTSCFFLSINQTTGVLEGTPDDSDIGEWWVNVTVYDGVGGHDWTNFTINVTNVNDIPEILSGNIITAHEDRLYYNDYEVRDDDPPSAGDLIWWSLITTAPFLTIDNVTGNLSGTPTNDHVGRFNVGIMVTDGKGGEDSTFFILTVVNVNDAPSIKTTPETTATEDILFQIDFNATDIDPTYDDLEWAMNSSVPWLVINPDNGLLSGTPLNDHVGSWYVNVSVTDRKGGWDYIEFEVFVENINDDPIFLIESIPDAIEDQYYWKIIEAEDIDPTNDTIEFSLIKSDCNCFSINPISGNLTGLPFNEDVGRHWFVIGVIDGIGGQITKNFSFRVINVNDNPSIEPFDIPQMLEDQYIEFDLNASDIDPTYDEISWNIMKSNIDFLRIDKVTGKLYGTPENEDVGSCWILVNASDDKGGYTLENISFNVININDDPEILEFDIPDIIEDIPFFLDMEAVDIDPTNDELEWELRTNAHFIDIDPSSGNLTGTPSNDDVGTWWVNVSVSDGNGGMDQINFSLTILNVNDIPELNKTEMTLTMDEDSDGTSIDLRDVFFDIDGDVLSYDHEDSNNLTISVEGTTVMITPDPDWCGIEIVEFTASDGHGSVSLNVTIDVKPINDAPTDAKIIAGSKYVEGEKQIVDSSAVDVDIPFGDELTYSWSSDISGEIGVGQSLDLSLPAGNHLITLTVTDKEGLSVTTTKEIEVEPVEDNNGSEVGLILIIILIIVVVLAALIFGFMIIRRKRNEGPVEGDGGPNTDHVEDTIAVEEQFEDTMQQVQSPEEVNDPGMDPPMAETSFPEMNVNDGQNNELIVEEQIGNDIPMESDVIPTETDELVFQDGPENPFLGESEDLNS